MAGKRVIAFAMPKGEYSSASENASERGGNNQSQQ